MAASVSYIDLSSLPKYHDAIDPKADYLQIFNQIKEASAKTIGNTHDRFEAVLSCYKIGETSFQTYSEQLEISPNDVPPKDTIRKLVFPLWVLLALVPEAGKKTIITDVVFAHFGNLEDLKNSLECFKQYARGTGRLEIPMLKFFCEPVLKDSANFDDKILKDCLHSLGLNIEVGIVTIYLTNNFFSQNAAPLSCIREINTANKSPHIMFGNCHGISNLQQPAQSAAQPYPKFRGDRILIATLGFGYNPSPFCHISTDTATDKISLPVSESKNFATSNTDGGTSAHNTGGFVSDQFYTIHWFIHSYSKTSKFITCITIDDTNTIVNGATARAINWLREEWNKKRWKWKDQKGVEEPYDNLIIVIPYGGQYMEDEMIAITKAIDEEGIVIVCAAGECKEGGGGDVLFPAALGTPISVGVVGTGPIGREVDVSVDFSKKPAKMPLYVGGDIELPRDCGIAVARIAGLLSLLLSRVNTMLRSSSHNLDESRQKANTILTISHYLHTCVIRELLVNVANGSHNSQRGYGDGEKIINSLLNMKDDELCNSLSRVLVKGTGGLACCQSSDFYEAKMGNFARHAHLNGRGINVAVIDCKKMQKKFCIVVKTNPYNTVFKSFQGHASSDAHGDECAAVVRAIAYESTIWRTNCITCNDMSHAFEGCTDPDIPWYFNLISCSISVPNFDFSLCSAINKAVMNRSIIVFAAGNSGQKKPNSIQYPGRFGNIIVVGGCDEHHNALGFSSVGREMDYLSKADYYHEGIGKNLSGTSYAAPAVTGYIALLLQFIREQLGDVKIEAWSRDGNGWAQIPAFIAAHNVYAMRTLLKKFSQKLQVHSEKEGFGPLVYPEKLNDAASTMPEIIRTLQKFYKRDTNLNN